MPSTTNARDGTKLVFEVVGTNGPRIALIHSLAMDRHFWSAVAARLAGTASVLTYDCRGHGESGKPPGPYTVEQFADDLADILDTAGWGSAVVAGASMGGSVALAFAGRHRAMVEGLGLVDTTAWYGADAPRQWSERADTALSNGLESLVAFQQTRWFGETFRADRGDVVATSVEVFLRNDVAAYAASCRMLGAADLRGLLPAIQVPTRVLVGEEDFATPLAMAEALHAGIPGSVLAVIPAGRHLTPLEYPDRVAAELRALLEAAP